MRRRSFLAGVAVAPLLARMPAAAPAATGGVYTLKLRSYTQLWSVAPGCSALFLGLEGPPDYAVIDKAEPPRYVRHYVEGDE